MPTFLSQHVSYLVLSNNNKKTNTVCSHEITLRSEPFQMFTPISADRINYMTIKVGGGIEEVSIVSISQAPPWEVE